MKRPDQNTYTGDYDALIRECLESKPDLSELFSKYHSMTLEELKNEIGALYYAGFALKQVYCAKHIALAQAKRVKLDTEYKEWLRAKRARQADRVREDQIRKLRGTERRIYKKYGVTLEELAKEILSHRSKE